MGMRVDDDNLRLGRHTPEYPASGTTLQGDTPKTGIDVLDNRGTRDPSCLGP